jgi:hypothetical protein
VKSGMSQSEHDHDHDHDHSSFNHSMNPSINHRVDSRSHKSEPQLIYFHLSHNATESSLFDRSVSIPSGHRTAQSSIRKFQIVSKRSLSSPPQSRKAAQERLCGVCLGRAVCALSLIRKDCPFRAHPLRVIPGKVDEGEINPQKVIQNQTIALFAQIFRGRSISSRNMAAVNISSGCPPPRCTQTFDRPISGWISIRKGESATAGLVQRAGTRHESRSISNPGKT